MGSAGHSGSNQEEPTRWYREAFNGYAHATSRANQCLATEWGRLTAIDIQAIKNSIVRRLDGNATLAEAEAVVLILGILTTGRQASDWLATHVVSDTFGDRSDVILRDTGIQWHWLLPVGSSQSEGPPSDELLIRPERYVELMCVELMKAALEICFESRFGSKKLPPMPFSLFSTWSSNPKAREQSEREVRKRAAEIIRERIGARSSTLTLQSLERWFWAAAAQTEAGDPTSTCRMTGREENPYRAQSFYGVLSRRAASKLQLHTLKRAGLSEHNVKNLCSEGYIGSRRSPSDTLIGHFAAHSSKTVRAARRSHDNQKLHNALTLHTAAVVMLSTGLRPARKANLQILMDRGVALVFDKVVGDPRVRPVPIGRLCREQMVFYAAHVAASDPAPRIDDPFGAHDELKFIMFDSRGRKRPMSLAACWRLALRSFRANLPSNLQRHFLRTTLVGSASAESIDAMLGHWVVGTEPWGRYSGLDPFIYAEDVRPLVDNALGRAGWQAEHGLEAEASAQFSRALISIGPPLAYSPSDQVRGLQAEPSPFNSLLIEKADEHLLPRLSEYLFVHLACPQAALGQILASAVINGAFLDPKWFGPFIQSLKAMPLTQSRLCVEMAPADPEDKRHVYAYPRRWFCDPFTDLLIRRWRADHAASPIDFAPVPDECFAAFSLTDNNSPQPASLKQLVDEAILHWRLVMPGLLVGHADGNGPALSLPPTTWDRVISGRPIAAKKPVAETTTRETTNRLSYPKQYQMLKRALLSSEPKKRTVEVEASISGKDDTLAAHLVRWANLAIHSRGKASDGRREWGKKTPYSARNTISGYTTALADILFENLGNDLCDIDAEKLDTLYRHGFEKAGDRKRALNAVSLFQAYLCALNPELDVGDSYDELREEGRVSVNMVSSADYLRALEQLPGKGREDRLLRLILTLAFRAGLRLNEILGLRHVDVVCSISSSGAPLMELYVRPYGWRALKTKQSRRMIPLDVLLRPLELDELRTWCEDHEAEARNRPLGLLFTHAGGGAGEFYARTVRRRLEEALVRSTGDEGMRFEHLRHAFATQLLACLLLPKEGSDLSIPAGLDDDSISEARRERIIARISGSARPGRSAMHIVSQLCGHGPVTTTLRWYSHMLDWSVGAFVNRRCLQPRIARRTALSAMKRTQPGYRSESLSRADHRFRSSISQRAPNRGEWENYRTPMLTPQVDWANDDIPLMAVHRSIQRGLDRECGDDFTPRFRPLRRRNALVSNKASDLLPPWRSIRDAVIALRAGSDPDEQAALLGATKEEVIRYREIADVIAGPRRRGEKHMRFEPKMSSSKRAVFDVENWRNIFPQEPRGRDALDVVDHIWRKAQRVHTHAHVRWALEEFCRYHSVDNGVTTFMKRKDATRFYRGMAMLGFAETMSVRPLGGKSCCETNCIRGRNQNGGHGCDQLRWHLTKGLPKGLRPPEPITHSSREAPFPRSVAIQIGVPRLPSRRFEDPVKTNNHTRSAVRFAITMIAIVALDGVREPPRRTGRRPGYGGYF